MNEVSVSNFEEGRLFDFGITLLSEEDIIAFATAFDPLDFHIDKEKAKKSYFKGIIASGAHMFTKVHREKWIPLFKDTVICGIEINNWKFLKPIYPSQPIHGVVIITSIKRNPEHRHVVINWRYEFKNTENEMVQCMEMLIMHKID